MWPSAPAGATGAPPAFAAASEPPAAPPAADSESTRFVLELEFVQLLADPAYVCYVVQQHLHKDGFAAYLRYLHGHWSTLPYARHLRWPLGLVHLRLLVLDADFCEAARDDDFIVTLRDAELGAWRAAAVAGDAAAAAAAEAAAAAAAAARKRAATT